MSSIVISGTGSYLPDVVVTNDDIASMDTDFNPVRAKMSLDQWARKYIGAQTRHYARPGEGPSDMGTIAGRRALHDAQIDPCAIDLVVLSTVTGDYRVPQTAALVQANLGICGQFLQLDSVCTGFIDALLTADGIMERMGYEHALVIGSEVMSFIVDPHDYKQMVTFGDAAGAVVLSRVPDDGYGLKSYSCGSDGGKGFTIWIPGGGSKSPLTAEAITQGKQYFQFNFAPIYNFAVERMATCTTQAVERAGITLDDLKWVIPHQASVNIILDTARRLELAPEMFKIIFERTANVSSASIPMALDEANREGQLAHGDWMVMPSVGAGMAWGAACLRWYDYKAARDGGHSQAANAQHAGNGNGHTHSGNGSSEPVRHSPGVY